jgi:hypothetical protein
LAAVNDLPVLMIALPVEMKVRRPGWPVFGRNFTGYKPGRLA